MTSVSDEGPAPGWALYSCVIVRLPPYEVIWKGKEEETSYILDNMSASHSNSWSETATTNKFPTSCLHTFNTAVASHALETKHFYTELPVHIDHHHHHHHHHVSIGCFKKSFTNLKAYINLFWGHVQCVAVTTHSMVIPLTNRSERYVTPPSRRHWTGDTSLESTCRTMRVGKHAKAWLRTTEQKPTPAVC
jgi:hypothetical protein